MRLGLPQIQVNKMLYYDFPWDPPPVYTIVKSSAKYITIIAILIRIGEN